MDILDNEKPIELILSELHYTKNVERDKTRNFMMYIYVQDTEKGRHIITSFDQVMWNVSVEYHRWVEEMTNLYREGYTIQSAIRR